MPSRPPYARALTQLCKERGMTQTALAAKLGTARPVVNRWVTGVREPDAHNRDRIEAILALGKRHGGERPLYALVRIDAQRGPVGWLADEAKRPGVFRDRDLADATVRLMRADGFDDAALVPIYRAFLADLLQRAGNPPPYPHGDHLLDGGRGPVRDRLAMFLTQYAITINEPGPLVELDAEVTA